MQEDENKDSLTPEEELNAENEMELLRLNLEYGAESYIDEDAPPEVVRMFLQQIRSFEEKFKDGGEMSTVSEALLGLEVKDPDEILETDLEEEIDNVLDKYLERGIMIDRPDHLTAREYYTFLTSDLLEQPIMTDRPKGFTAGYLYNEIFQDHPDFIVDNAILEIEDILSLEYPYEAFNLTFEVNAEKGPLPFEDIKLSVIEWRKQFDKIDKIALELEDTLEDGSFYHLTFDIHYKTVDKKGIETDHKGLCLVQMVLEDRDWRVLSLKMPGFKL